VVNRPLYKSNISDPFIVPQHFIYVVNGDRYMSIISEPFIMPHCFIYGVHDDSSQVKHFWQFNSEPTLYIGGMRCPLQVRNFWPHSQHPTFYLWDQWCPLKIKHLFTPSPPSNLLSTVLWNCTHHDKAEILLIWRLTKIKDLYKSLQKSINQSTHHNFKTTELGGSGHDNQPICD